MQASNFYIVAFRPPGILQSLAYFVSFEERGAQDQEPRKIALIIQGVRKCLNHDLNLGLADPVESKRNNHPNLT